MTALTTRADALIAVVADDDAVTRRVLTLLLSRQGFQVLAATDGASALALVREAQPRVVFLDARMPAPDGFQVCRTIRATFPAEAQPHITMITAAGQDADRQQAAEAGVDDFLTKPFSPSQLSTRLQLLRLEALS